MTFTDDCARTAEALKAFLDRSRSGADRVISQPPMAGLAEALGIDRWLAEGGLQGPSLSGFLETYLAASTRLHSPRYMAHQVAVPHPSGAIGAMVDGMLNNGPVLYEMGPAGAAVDYQLLNWMLGKVGWEPAPLPGRGDLQGAHGGGALVHGGSLANLTALMAARGAAAPDAWRDGLPADLVLVAPEACHYSIGRAADILGLGRGRRLAPPTDADGQIEPARLPGFLRGLRAQGRRVLALVANACSTPAGLFDPLRAVGEVCREQGVWLHVDGAHGASALVSARLRGLLDGVELADSLVWDAHKMLRAPIVCAAVLARDGRRLDRAFHQEASYLFHDKDQPGVDLIHRSVECTKGGLGLRAFMALAAEGEAAMAAYLERQAELARAAAEWIQARPGFELAVAPPFNIVCFRLDGSDDLQLELRKRLLERGEFYITTTQFRGRRWLRLTLINPDTSLEDVQALVRELERLRRPNRAASQL